MSRFGSGIKKNAIARFRAMMETRKAPTDVVEFRSGFNKHELEDVKSVFRYFDQDKNKHLDRKEIAQLFRHQTGYQVDSKTLEMVFEKMDTNGDGRVSFPEYLEHVALRKKRLPTNHSLGEVFEAFDRNEDGRHNLDDFRHALLYLGEDAGRADLRNIFVRHDADKDGLITKFEFQDILRQEFRSP